MRYFTLRERLRYRFDTMMARGTIAVIFWLFVLSLAIVLGVAAVVYVLGWAPERDGQRPGFQELAWMSLMRTLDPGTMGGDSGSWPFLFAMLFVTTAGIFVVGTLIGLISSGIHRRLEELRKGRSPVVEHEHLVLLGWSAHIFTLVRELAIANGPRRRSCITILADRDKAEMEDELRARVGATGRTRLVCRTGNPTDPADLSIVHPEGARVLVILPDDSSRSDVHVIKILYGLAGLRGLGPGDRRIITAVRDPAQADVIRLAAGPGARLVIADEVMARVLAQTARQPGLSRVYKELLDFFEGNDVYFVRARELEGATYGHALLAHENACTIGIRAADGAIRLNPPTGTPILAGDRLIVIAEGVASIRTTRANQDAPGSSAGEPALPGARSESMAIINWNRRAHLLVRELDLHASAGSRLTVIADHPSAEREIELLGPRLERLTIEYRAGNTRERASLAQLVDASTTTVVVLPDSDAQTPDDADAGVLVAVTCLRALERKPGATMSIIAETLDSRTSPLSEAAGADDGISGDRLVSLLLAQLAENAEMSGVLDELFDAAGCFVMMHPVRDYLTVRGPVTFRTVVEAAKSQGRSAIGYQLVGLARDLTRNRGIVLNPPKSGAVTFGDADRIIVVGEY